MSFHNLDPAFTPLQILTIKGHSPFLLDMERIQIRDNTTPLRAWFTTVCSVYCSRQFLPM